MTALPKPAYVMSEPHLSGYRVIIGYETLVDAQEAQAALSKPQAREDAGSNEREARQDWLYDSAYAAGLKAGWNFAQEDNEDGLNGAIEQRVIGHRAVIEATRAEDKAREDAQPVRWLIEDLILPQETVTDNEAYAQRRAEYRYEGEATARVRPLYTHPAAPSGDKLRIAVEALETSRENLIGWFEAIDAEIRVEHEMHVSLKDDLAVIDQALATLKAEG